MYSPFLRLLVLSIAMTLFPSTDIVTDLPEPAEPFPEEEFYKGYYECTTGIASADATPDGRPLLWKNRDVFDDRQEYHYVDDNGIPFIGLTDGGEVSEYYAGLNAAGFAIENSDPVNLGGPNAINNGYGSGADDGELIMHALSSCRTVDDFDALLDSLNENGRTHDSNYGTVDAFGGAAMFEADGYRFTRYDAVDSPDGFLIRSNFSYSGAGGEEYSGYSRERHDRALELWKAAVDQDRLTPRYIFQKVIRDLKCEGMEDYALPYEGYWQNNPYGVIPNGATICRSTTRSVMVVQGAAQGGRPDDAILWAMGSNPVGSVATPLWVRAGSVPVEYDDGDNNTRLCQVAVYWRNWATEDQGVNSFKLTNREQTGYWDFTLRLEDWMFAKVERFLNSPRFNYDRLEAFQNELVEQIVDSLESWRPATSLTEIVEPVVGDGFIVLAWEPVERDPFGGDEPPRGYTVYRCDQPFRLGVPGERLAVTRQNRYVDEQPPPGNAFYRVELLF